MSGEPLAAWLEALCLLAEMNGGTLITNRHAKQLRKILRAFTGTREPAAREGERYVRVSKVEWARALDAMGIPRDKWQPDTLAAARPPQSDEREPGAQ